MPKREMRMKDGAFVWNGDPESPINTEGDLDKDARIRELEAQVDRLEKSERAILNVLEDERELEEKLRDRAEELKKFQMAVEQSFDLVVITDTKPTILYANPSVERVSGYAADEAIGQAPSLWGRQMPADFYRELWETIAVRKERFFSQVTNHKKNGETYVAELGIIPLLGEDGEIKFYVGVQRDITERKLFEERLLDQAKTLEQANANLGDEKRKSEAILRFLRSIGDGVVATDIDGRIIFANEAFRSLCLAMGDIEGREHEQVFQMHSDDDKVSDICPVKSILNGGGGETIYAQASFVRSDNVSVPVSYSASPIRDTSDVIIGSILVFKDRSEERERERLKDRFLSVAAHQLRTPLSGIRWSLEMLLSGDVGDLSDETRETIERIYKNNQRMILLVNDLLDVSRINEGRIESPSETVDIAEIVGHVVADMAPGAKEKGVSIVFETSGEGSRMRALVVPAQYYEIVENLVSNGVKYSKCDGTVYVKLALKDGMMHLSVRDEGIGIPASEQNRVFAKFFRASNAIRKETEGSGLGLSVVKSFVESVGGKVWFESKEGEGSVFSVEVPAASESEKSE